MYIFALPFPIFDLVHVQTIWSFVHRWPAVSPNSFYPVTDITAEENSCYPNSSLPGTFGPGL